MLTILSFPSALLLPQKRDGEESEYGKRYFSA